jgi:hypothetical protein
MVVSAFLLVVIGIPAALIGIRSPPPAPAPHELACAGNACQRARIVPPAEHAPAVADVTPIPAPAVSLNGRAPLRKNRGADEDGTVANEPVGEAVSAKAAAPSAPAAQALAAPPPPPPPAPPPPPPPPPASVASAERDGAQKSSQDVVVTGTLIRQPGVSAFERPSRKARRSTESSKLTDAKPVPREQAYAAFLSRLQGAVRADDRHAIVALIAFPLQVNGAGHTRSYRDAASVERDFDQIFTPRVRRAIAGQSSRELFVRDQGAMIGDGEVWFDQTCLNVSCSPAGPVRIRAINP